MTILSKTDTGRDDRSGDRIFAFNKSVVAFEDTQAKLTQRRARLINRQGIMTNLLALVDDGDDISDLIGVADPSRDALARQSLQILDSIVTVDEALALFP